MIGVPDTIANLIDRLEAGDDPTPEELRRTQRLQALHIARIGEEYLLESLEREDAAHEQFRQAMEGD